MGVLHHIETFRSIWGNTFAILEGLQVKLQRIADVIQDWPRYYYYFMLVEDVMIFLACRRQLLLWCYDLVFYLACFIKGNDHLPSHYHKHSKQIFEISRHSSA